MWGKRDLVGRISMSIELDEFGRALTHLLRVINTHDKASAVDAITEVVDNLTLALGSIEHRLDTLEKRFSPAKQPEHTV